MAKWGILGGRWWLIRLSVCLCAAWHIVAGVHAFDPLAGNLWKLGQSLTSKPGAQSAALDWTYLPSSVDMRGEIEALRVNFIQQGMRNSCAAFSATSTLEFQLRRLGYNVDLSEQYTLWATTQVGANPARGLSNDELARGLGKFGICREELMPYKKVDRIVPPTRAAREDAARFPEIRMREVVGHDGVYGLSPEEILTICQTLATREPLCYSTRWTETEARLAKGYFVQDGRMDVPHMVMLTGYEIPEGDPLDGYFRIRNSWGLAWGDFGYAKIPFRHALKHGIDAVQFHFVWEGGDGAPSAAERQSRELAGMLPGYAAQSSLIALAAGFAAVLVPALLFGRRRRGLPGLVGYLLLFFPVYVVLVLASGALAAHSASSNHRLIILLAVSVLLLVGILVRLTMRHFGVGFLRACAMLLLGGVLFNLLLIVGATMMPSESYQRAREELGGIPALGLAGMALMEEAGRAEMLLAVRSRHAPLASDPAHHALWLEDWHRRLKIQKRLMQKDKPLSAAAVRFYMQRVEVYQRMARERPGGRSGEDPRAE